MKSWEFLIQKHGKNAWFPLKKQKLKLPEGRYRIVAQCDRPNLEVEVRVTHQTVETTSNKRRSQQRQGRTNTEGLMVIVPFVNFTPGLWEIRASSDIMSDLMGENWQKTVKLRVLSQDSEVFAEHPPTTSPQATADFEIPTEESVDSEPEETENPIEPVVEAVSETISTENDAIPATADSPAELGWPVEESVSEDFVISDAETSDRETQEAENPIEPVVEAVSETISTENDAIPATVATPAELGWPVEENVSEDFTISDAETSDRESPETKNPIEPVVEAVSETISTENDEIPATAATPAELGWPVEESVSEDFAISDVENSDRESPETENPIEPVVESVSETIPTENDTIPATAATPAELGWPVEESVSEDFAISDAENSNYETQEAENPIEPVVEAVSETISTENDAIPATVATPAELGWPVEENVSEDFVISDVENSDRESPETENPIEPVVEAVSETISAENDTIPATAATPAELNWPVENRVPEDNDFVVSEVENSLSEPQETEITSNPVEAPENSLSEAMFGETAVTEDFVFSETETPEIDEDREAETTDLKSLLDQSIQSLEEILKQADRPPEIEETAEIPPETPSQPEAVNPSEQWVEQMRDRVANLKLHLSLNHDNYVRYGAENLFISGQVNAPANNSKDLNILLAPVSDQQATLRLQYHLRDPQSTAFYDPERPPENIQTQPLYSNQSATSESNLPLIFGFNLGIDSQFHQPLILGEAILELQIQAKTQTATHTVILARQPFTITAALDELLETAFPREKAPSQTATAVAPVALKTDFVDLTKSPEAVPLSQFNPKNKQPLPPKLSTVKKESPKRSLDLPPFNPPPEYSPLASDAIAPEIPEIPEIVTEEVPETPETPETPESSGLEQPPIQFFADANANSSSEAIASVWDEPLGSELEGETVNPDAVDFSSEDFTAFESEPPTPANPEADAAFQSLQLQDRFWHRMNSLAEDASFFSTNWQPVETTEETPETPDFTDFETEEIVESTPDDAIAHTPETETLPDETESVVIPTPPPIQLPFEDLLAPPPPLRWTQEAAQVDETEDLETPAVEGMDWDSDEEDMALESSSETVDDDEIEPPSSFFPSTPQAPEEAPEDDAIAPEVLFAPNPPETPPPAANAEYYNPEIVVDDDRDWYAPPPPRRDTSGLPYPDEIRVSAQEALGGVMRQNSTPIPVPILTVTEGELIAGEPVLVRVKLPPQSGAIYVKLWVLDCETRHLLDGPRALVDFMTLPTGELETMTQLQVPLGSRSIRFEAIAIDIATQRESRKATTDRSAIPPDLPDFSPDLF